MVQLGMVWYSMVRYGTVWYGTARYSTARYGTVLYGMVWYFPSHDSMRSNKFFEISKSPNLQIGTAVMPENYSASLPKEMFFTTNLRCTWNTLGAV